MISLQDLKWYIKTWLIYCNKFGPRGKNRIKLFCPTSTYLKGISLNSTGENNKITLEDEMSAINMKVEFRGNNNKLVIKKQCDIRGVYFEFVGDNAIIQIGENAHFSGQNVSVCVTDDRKIIIGKDCLFSHSIEISTSDYHQIYDELGEYVNPDKDVYIEDHCWIGKNCTILKGAKLCSDTVVGACSLVNKRFSQGACVVAGNPAKIVKENVSWKIY